jgi:hypothetical protein
MTNRGPHTTDCLFVGEYVDEAELPIDLVSTRSEVARPKIVGSDFDDESDIEGEREL